MPSVYGNFLESLEFELNHIKLNPNRHIDNTYYYTHEI
jgi:hypothetical protein